MYAYAYMCIINLTEGLSFVLILALRLGPTYSRIMNLGSAISD